jgi:hypothetical protein
VVEPEAVGAAIGADVAAVLLTEFAAARLTRNVVDAFLPEGVR